MHRYLHVASFAENIKIIDVPISQTFREYLCEGYVTVCQCNYRQYANVQIIQPHVTAPCGEPWGWGAVEDTPITHSVYLLSSQSPPVTHTPPHLWRANQIPLQWHH